MDQGIATLNDGIPGWRVRLATWRDDAIVAERGRFALFLPVGMIVGVVAYFALRQEPPWWLGVAALAFALSAALLLRRSVVLFAAVSLLAAVALGFALAQWRTLAAAQLVPIPHRALMVSGRVAGIDLLPGGGRRVLIGHVRWPGLSAPLARRVRVRLRGSDATKLQTGDALRVRALIFAPFVPAYPGGWDLQRSAFFENLAGYGFALGQVQVTATHGGSGIGSWWQGVRDRIAARVMSIVPGTRGAIAATLLTGSKTAIPMPVRAAFAAAGLAHLLAVAGLHIGIVMGLVFAAVRFLLALSERTALFWPAKEIAGLSALAAGAFYMALTGMHLPIERSFAMASLVTLALLAGRHPFSLRGLAVAAVVIMLFEPDQVMGVSFQMSFAAVLALIAGYEALRPALARAAGARGRLRRLGMVVFFLALTSLLAGGASAPFAAYHFGQFQPYFIFANVLAVPLTALWVMPLGLLALALMPLGLSAVALVPMGWGVAGLIMLARSVATWPAATLAVPPMPGWGIVLVAAGMAWLGLWRRPHRLLGLLPLAVGLVSPLLVRPPDLLVSPRARLIAFRAPDGTVWRQRLGGSSKFVREEWVRVLGTAPPRRFAADTQALGVRCAAGRCRLSGARGGAPALLLLKGAAPPASCARYALVVSAVPLRGACRGDAPALIDRFTVWRDGAAMAWLGPGPARIMTDRSARGARPWVPPPPVPRARAGRRHGARAGASPRSASRWPMARTD